MSQFPVITVLIPTCNRAGLLGDAIDSILAQSFSDFELLIVDDYSADRTTEVVTSYSDPRVRLYRKSSEPRGVATSRNVGYTLARGEFIVNMDDDDLAHPQRLEKLLKAVRTYGPDAVVGSWITHVADGVSTTQCYPESHEEIVKVINRKFNRVGIVAGTIIAPRQLLLKFGCRVQFPVMSDWDMILRMKESGHVRFHNVPETLYIYRRQPGSLSLSGARIMLNLFLLACESRRKQGKPEFANLDEYERAYRRISFWSAGQRLIKLLKYVQVWLKKTV